MIERPVSPDFSQTVRQKVDPNGTALPIWSWQLEQGGGVVAFGQCRTEQAALAAAQSAIRTRGLSLAALAQPQSGTT